MGTDAVDDRLDIAPPLKTGSFDRELVALQSKCFLAPVLGMSAIGDGEETQYEPFAFRGMLPTERSVGSQLCGQVDGMRKVC